jgi:hypothetical protein
MSSQTSPYDNISPADIPPCPSRASPAPPINLGARGIAEMALPPTLHQEKNNPFPIDAARCEDYPQDPTSPHDNISAAAAVATTIPLTAANLINNQQTTGSGGAGGATGRRHDEGQGHAHNNQIDHAEGGGSRRRRRR